MALDLATSIYVASATAALGLIAHMLRPRLGFRRLSWPKIKVQLQRQFLNGTHVTDGIVEITGGTKSRKSLKIAVYFVISRNN